MSFRWGIFGTGAISAKFVAGLARAQGARAVMVASRSGTRASEFARAFGIERAIEGYEAAAGAPDVDAIYIATPPSQHLAHALACIAAGKAVLVEKPFTRDAGEAQRLAAAAREAGVFCMEAMWTRFLPAARQMQALVRQGAIGEIRQVSGSFGFGYRPDPRLGHFDATRGGGALAHMGVYPVSLAQWLFGPPLEVAALGRIGESGVEEDVSIALRFASGALGSFHASIRANAANDFRLSGTQGAIAFAGPVFRPWGLKVDKAMPRGAASEPAHPSFREKHWPQRLNQFRSALMPGGRAQRHFFAGNGYHYEADEVARCVAAGHTESAVMPLADSIAVLSTLDRVRTAIAGGAA